MAEDLREALPWGLLVAGFVSLGVAFLGIRALASFAAGLAWWASGLMFAGLPLTAAAVVVAWRQQRRAALVVSLVVLVGWVTFWMLILAVFLSA